MSDVVLYGSPGTELTDASQLGVPPGHAYYKIGANDVVSELIPGFDAFGAAPQDVPGMAELSADTGYAWSGPFGDGQLHERAYGHSEYARDGKQREPAYEWLQPCGGAGRAARRPDHPLAGRP